jgi:hypothetical protein
MRFILKIVLLLVIGLMLSLSNGHSLILGSSGSSYSSSVLQTGGCSTPVMNAFVEVNSTNAILSAEQSSFFHEMTASLWNVSYYNTFESGNALPPTCNITNATVGVVFTSNDSQGFAYAVLFLNGSTLSPIGYQIEQNPPEFSTHYGADWAGYEVYANSGASTNVLQAQGDFYAPSPYWPSPYWPSTGCYNNNPCAVSAWWGLTDAEGGQGGGLAQNGVLTTLSCQKCFPQYSEWYELLGTGGTNGAVTCGSSDINGGDPIYGYTANGALFGYSDTLYYFYVSDAKTGAYCSTSDTFSSMPNPTRAEFISEDPSDCSCSLAAYTDIQFYSSGIYTSSSFYYIDQLIANGYYNEFVMQNALYYPKSGLCGTPVTNAQPSSATSPGDFQVQYDSSEYTPAYPGVYC